MSLLSSIVKLFKDAEPTAPANESLIPFIRTDLTYKVVNAGERVVIGIYTRRTSFGLTFNGKPYYTLKNEDDSDPNGAKRHCLYYQDGWKITDAEGDIAYTSNAVETPDLAEWSVASAGTLFLPIVVEGDEESVLNQVSLEDLSNAISGGVKVYRALLTQSGTDAPVATVLENTLGEVPVLGRNDSGQYTLTCPGEIFVAVKTFVSVASAPPNGDSDAGYFAGAVAKGATITFKTAQVVAGAVTYADGLLNAASIEILVYP